MPDIRNFFGGKGSQGISSSQEQPTVGKGRGNKTHFLQQADGVNVT